MGTSPGTLVGTVSSSFNSCTESKFNSQPEIPPKMHLQASLLQETVGLDTPEVKVRALGTFPFLFFPTYNKAVYAITLDVNAYHTIQTFLFWVLVEANLVQLASLVSIRVSHPL